MKSLRFLTITSVVLSLCTFFGCEDTDPVPLNTTQKTAMSVFADTSELHQSLMAIKQNTINPSQRQAMEITLSILATSVEFTLGDLRWRKANNETTLTRYEALEAGIKAAMAPETLALMPSEVATQIETTLNAALEKIIPGKTALGDIASRKFTLSSSWKTYLARAKTDTEKSLAKIDDIIAHIDNSTAGTADYAASAPIKELRRQASAYLELVVKEGLEKSQVDANWWSMGKAHGSTQAALIQLAGEWFATSPFNGIGGGLPHPDFVEDGDGNGGSCIKMATGNDAGSASQVTTGLIGASGISVLAPPSTVPATIPSSSSGSSSGGGSGNGSSGFAPCPSVCGEGNIPIPSPFQ